MSKTATLEINGQKHEFPLIEGTENEIAIDIKNLRGVTGGVTTIDPGYKNTGSCESAITFLNGEEVSDEIREMKVSNAVSKVASDPMVRAHVNKLMRAEVEKDVFIADGRDLGTAVFPNAELKFFMVAELEERAKRRLAEMEAQGLEASLEEIKSNLEARDNADSNRASDPLKQAEDAILINTSELSFEEQVSQISERIRQIMPKNKQ